MCLSFIMKELQHSYMAYAQSHGNSAITDIYLLKNIRKCLSCGGCDLWLAKYFEIANILTFAVYWGRISFQKNLSISLETLCVYGHEYLYCSLQHKHILSEWVSISALQMSRKQTLFGETHLLC